MENEINDSKLYLSSIVKGTSIVSVLVVAIYIFANMKQISFLNLMHVDTKFFFSNNINIIELAEEALLIFIFLSAPVFFIMILTKSDYISDFYTNIFIIAMAIFFVVMFYSNMLIPYIVPYIKVLFLDYARAQVLTKSIWYLFELPFFVFILFKTNRKFTKLLSIIIIMASISLLGGTLAGIKEFDSNRYSVILGEHNKVIITSYKDGFLVADLDENGYFLPDYFYYELKENEDLFSTSDDVRLITIFNYVETNSDGSNFVAKIISDLDEGIDVNRFDLCFAMNCLGEDFGLFESKEKLISRFLDFYDNYPEYFQHVDY